MKFAYVDKEVRNINKKKLHDGKNQKNTEDIYKIMLTNIINFYLAFYFLIITSSAIL